jgi:hypothetical protein
LYAIFLSSERRSPRRSPDSFREKSLKKNILELVQKKS